MAWNLADSVGSADLAAGGGAAHDIAQMVFAAKTAQAIKKRVHEYVTAMRLAGKDPSRVQLSVDDYNKLVASVAKAGGVKVSEITGLRHDGIPVVCGR